MHAPLRRRLLFINIGLVVGLSIIGVALIWGIRSLRDDVASAASEYTELRLIEEAMLYASLAKTSLDDDGTDLARAAEHVDNALQKLQSFVRFQETEESPDVQHQEQEMREEVRATKALAGLSNRIKQELANGSAVMDDRVSEQLADTALLALSRMAVQTDVVQARSATAELTVTTLMVVGALASLIVVGALAATVICYRTVMVPLHRVHSGVRRIARGEFSHRLPEERTREFAELGADFNHMAAELQTLYRDLEHKVQQKSRELVKSERLASVGYLAAGVAHEINNPLGIMSGYAELAQGWMADPRSQNSADLRNALEIIRTEAFRCKAITERLLSLARLGNAARTVESLSVLAREVADTVHGLHKYQDRHLLLRFSNSADLSIKGNSDELKQVILNLLVNALEAVPPGTGEVTMTGSRSNGCVQLVVQDNGIGMTPEVLERAFEPFFSARASPGVRGTGLGLAISHSIVESHGGTLRAESEGAGHGSRFIVEMPVASQHESHGS